MANKDTLKIWVKEALSEFGGSAKLVEVAKYIWENHEQELRSSGDLFYTWQYDMRWAATSLRRAGVMAEGWNLKL
ncbi:MAG: hypothetical protein QM656_09605 [Paracoccaceae bacterium]